MQFQEIMRGMVASKGAVWIISGQASDPVSTYSGVKGVANDHILVTGVPLKTFSTHGLFVMVGELLFRLDGCKVVKGGQGFVKIEFASAVLAWPMVSAGLNRVAPVVPSPHHNPIPTGAEVAFHGEEIEDDEEERESTSTAAEKVAEETGIRNASDDAGETAGGWSDLGEGDGDRMAVRSSQIEEQ